MTLGFAQRHRLLPERPQGLPSNLGDFAWLKPLRFRRLVLDPVAERGAQRPPSCEEVPPRVESCSLAPGHQTAEGAAWREEWGARV